MLFTMPIRMNNGSWDDAHAPLGKTVAPCIKSSGNRNVTLMAICGCFRVTCYLITLKVGIRKFNKFKQLLSKNYLSSDFHISSIVFWLITSAFRIMLMVQAGFSGELSSMDTVLYQTMSIFISLIVFIDFPQNLIR